MKVFVALAALIALVSAAPKPAEMYTDKYDNINLDEILNNERLYKNYVACLAGRGKCTPDGKELKESLPDALQNECKKCTQKQKDGADKVLRFTLEHHRSDFDDLAKLYDPENIYYEKYKGEAEKRGIKL